jgi:hypothetical protein
MQKNFITLSVMVLTFFILTGVCQAQDFIKEFSLKFTGGYSTIAVGDFNTVIETQDSYFETYAALFGATKEGELKKFHGGVEFEGEIIMNLTENFGIGIGAGYIQISNENETNLRHELAGEFTYFIKPKFTAVPVNLSLYYFYPVASSTNLYFNGGISYYFGKVTSTSRMDNEPTGGPPEWYRSEGEFKDQGLGFHGGIGLDYLIGSNIGLFLEGKVRYCKLKSWEGDDTLTYSSGVTDKNSGTLWFLEVSDPDIGAEFSQISLAEQKPSDPEIRNAREFEADLSGFSLRAGIRIRF